MNAFTAHTAHALSTISSELVPADVKLVIEQQIIDGNTIVERFSVVIANGVVSISPEVLADPDLTIRQDAETAAALQNGTAHAQRAFLTGRLSIDGDIDKLLEHGALLGTLLRGIDA